MVEFSFLGGVGGFRFLETRNLLKGKGREEDKVLLDSEYIRLVVVEWLWVGGALGEKNRNLGFLREIFELLKFSFLFLGLVLEGGLFRIIVELLFVWSESFMICC